MSQEFVAAEVNKIINEESIEFPKNMAMASAWILGNLKGINLKILDTSETSSLSDYFIMASATNLIQAKSMADDIVVFMKKHGLTVRSKEGLQGSDWILIDLGDIIVHIFLEAARSVYALEELWAKAPSVSIPENYYFSSDDAEAAQQIEESKDRDFF